MRLKIVFLLLLWVLLYAAPQKIFCGITPNTGFKYFKNYTPNEYGYSPQNWCVLQDKRGVIYVANQGGLLEFDGISWRPIKVPYKTVRSIAMDETGTIYIGGKNEMGFLAADRKGTLQYVSLVDHLKDNQKKISNVWETHAVNKRIYFVTSKYIFWWNPRRKKMDVLEPKLGRSFNASFSCNGEFFVHQRNVGLMRVENDTLKLIPGNNTFAAVKIYMMAPYDEKKLLIGTRSKGFYIYDGRKSMPFSTEADDYLKEKELYYGIRLTSSPGEFAIATRSGGLVIIDSYGRLKYIFNNHFGLQDDSVRYVFEDFQGNLWLGLNKGIAKIEYVSPLSMYDIRSDLDGLILSVTRHGPNNDLYAGTDKGLYFLASSAKFHQIQGIPGMCFFLLSTGDSLLAATTKGVFQVDNKNKIKRKVIESNSYYLYQSKKDTQRTWVGTQKGLVSLCLENGQWSKEHEFKKITGEIRSIVEDKKGNLWLGHTAEGVIKIDSPIINPGVAKYNKSHGLPAAQEVKVFMAAGHIMFATGKGLYRFVEEKKKFLPDSTLGDQFAGDEEGRGVFRMAEDRNKNIWLHSYNKNILAIPRSNGTFIIEKKPFLRVPHSEVYAIYPDPDGKCVWFASNYGLIRYDKSVKKDYDLDFSTVIRRVWINENLVFAGHKPTVNNDSESGHSFPVINYKDRKLRFEFAAPFFEGEEETRYSCFLESYETDWTAWVKDNKANYNNLDPGMYSFRVRAKNVYGNVSREDSYRFRVLPPWYQTWWAYLIYALAGLFVMFLIVRWRSGKLAREKQRLERVVKERTKEIEERTAEINEKNIRLEEQTGQLREQSEKLKEMDTVKSRFFANISHEFRTPLTLILGPLDQMIDACGEEEAEKKRKLTMMLRNSQRLLRLINQLLELSKLDSGKMKLRAVKADIVPFVKGIVDSFRVMTQQKELELVFQGEQKEEEGETMLYIDPRKMEDVMSNLLVNAVKFTPAGGQVIVTVEKDEIKQENINFPDGYVEIAVCDTGPGIPAGQLAHVFDRFFQADSTYEYHQKGSGIGLALSKELVELHHGAIRVENREEGGSRFVVRLPLGDAHLTADEIVESGVSEESADTQVIDYNALPSHEAKENKQKFWEVSEPFYKKVLTRRRQEKDIILVVEDSVDMRDYIRGALESDYTVVEAADGREGIEKTREIIPDLVISDIMMPEVDGYELCRALKSDVSTSHVPVILLTAKASEENVIEGFETGADDYITKPFSTKILLARIRNLIDIRGQLQQNINREMTLQPVKTGVSKIDREFFRELHDVINKNISDEDFNVEQLGRKLYLGRTTLYRKIMALSGLTPTDFIRSYRLKRGAELLKQNYGTVLEVAMEVGFYNSSYFAKCFKEKFHRLPSEYQAANKE